MEELPDYVPIPLIHPRLAFYSEHRPRFKARRTRPVAARLQSAASQPEHLDDLRMDPIDLIALFLQIEFLLAQCLGQGLTASQRSEAFTARWTMLRKYPSLLEYVRAAELASRSRSTVDAEDS